MAKIRVNCENGVWIEIDATSVKDAVVQLGAYQEVFGEPCCGRCNKRAFRWEHRQYDGHDYYSLKCSACRAQLDFGQHKVGGTLFPKRKTASGEYDNQYRGWRLWTERQNENDAGGETQ